MPATKKSLRTTSATSIAVLKTTSCPTLSGTSTLEYQLGKDTAGKYQLRISGSDGGGFYSKEWLELGAIQKALSAAKPITSVLLRPLLTGQSVNTCGFLLAALLKEKLVERLPDKTKHFRLCDTAAFLDKTSKLQPGKPATTTDATPKKKADSTVTKAPTKKPAKSPAKTSAAKPKAKPAAAK